MRKETKKTVEVIHTELVFPGDTNHYGTIFGGKTLSMMDMTGALAAMQFSNEEAVTASFESVDFKKALKEGDILEVRAKVIYTSNTSMVVKIDVYRIGKFHSRKDYGCGGYATFVAIDSNGEPRAIPQLKVTTKEEKNLWEVGKQIKQRAVERVKSSK
jgi:acyl-CoA hydrolase